MQPILSSSEHLKIQERELIGLFCSRLNQLAFNIRANGLSASESAELLDEESEALHLNALKDA